MKIKKIQLKAFCQKADNGKMRIIASDETIDRSGESIPFESWDLANFSKSPRLLIDHDYSVKSIVGKAEGIELNKELRALTFEPIFHDITQAAKDTKEMVEQGFLDTVSVGFLRNQDEKGAVTNELMEVSFVAVPANANARILAVKDITGDEEKAVKEFIGKKEEKAEGDVCTMEDGSEGVMGMNEEGEMVCMMKKIEPKEEEEEDEKAIEADEIKSGRILSQKNRGIITSAKDAMSSSIAALDELLKATEEAKEPSEGGEGEAEIANPEEKGRIPRMPEKDDSYQKFIELRKVTRAVVTAISEALKDAKLNK